MIVAYAKDPKLLAAVRRAAQPGEDVVVDSEAALDALAFGTPRLLLLLGDVLGPTVPVGDHVPVLRLDSTVLSRWESERKRFELPPRRVAFYADRVRQAVEAVGGTPNWVDRTLADLGRAAGSPIPPQLRAFARKVLEFPSHYLDLHAMAEASGMSRGALKARFRRRDLESPYTYIRWLRMMAVAHALSDRTVTIATAAHRLGFTSDGNLCRAMVSLTGLTPTEVRTVHGWNRLLISFAWMYLTPESLRRWSELGDLFEQVA